ncbi:MAG: glycerophosphoryl diester phosphodiesterase membrane domain-containing protein [Chloroflexi bacterium]|nr:glycerophosphoryl diester phosphodiesterase membrane domain-containing protein [Chloroflexota bacterium]
MERPILKELSIPEILDKALYLYRQHVGLLLKIGAFVFIPSAIVSAVFSFYFNGTRLLDNILNIFLPPIVHIALVTAISNLYLGRSVTIREAFSAVTKRYWTWFGTSLLMGLAMIPMGVVLWVMSLGGPFLGFLGLLVFLPVIVYLSTRWSLATSVIVIDNAGISESLRKSWTLTRDYFWRVLGTSFAAWLLSMLFSTLPSIFVTFLFGKMISIPINLLSAIITTVEQLAVIIVSPLYMGVNVLIYYDLRIRKEGFDLLFMAGEQTPETT